jgi:ATP-dependent RNA helicase RhlE
VHRIGRTGRAGLTGEAISLVAPEDLEALAAIEKLINKKLERVLVPGFANAGTVATLVSGETGEDAHRHKRADAGRSRQGSSRRPEHRPPQNSPRPAHHAQNGNPPARPQQIVQPKAPQKPHDPIFSLPYEPATAGSAPKAAEEPAAAHAKRRERPVAALLGGLKRA